MNIKIGDKYVCTGTIGDVGDVVFTKGKTYSISHLDDHKGVVNRRLTVGLVCDQKWIYKMWLDNFKSHFKPWKELVGLEKEIEELENFGYREENYSEIYQPIYGEENENREIEDDDEIDDDN